MKNLNITFVNEWHCGDVHMSRNYVKDLMNIMGSDHTYTFYHPNDISLLSDIPQLQSTNTIPVNSDMYINTWIGQYIHSGIPFEGCNYISYYGVMKKLYENLGLLNHLKPMIEYVPSIEYSYFKISNIDNYFELNKNKHILICNNDVMSGQAPNFSMNFLIDALAVEYPNYTFICTNPSTSIDKYSNVIYANDIINVDIKSNLNEISYLSTKCQSIIGRSSGPYSFSLTKENILNKKFICFCNKKADNWYHSFDDCQYPIWSNNYSENNILNVVKSVLGKI